MAKSCIATTWSSPGSRRETGCQGCTARAWHGSDDEKKKPGTGRRVSSEVVTRPLRLSGFSSRRAVHNRFRQVILKPRLPG